MRRNSKWLAIRSSEWTQKKNDELMHFGIKGMRWGIRRFQNEDGSLTAAGKERYDKYQTRADNSAKSAKKAHLTRKSIESRGEKNIGEGTAWRTYAKMETSSARAAIKAQAKANTLLPESQRRDMRGELRAADIETDRFTKKALNKADAAAYRAVLLSREGNASLKEIAERKFEASLWDSQIKEHKKIDKNDPFQKKAAKEYSDGSKKASDEFEQINQLTDVNAKVKAQNDFMKKIDAYNEEEKKFFADRNPQHDRYGRTLEEWERTHSEAIGFMESAVKKLKGEVEAKSFAEVTDGEYRLSPRQQKIYNEFGRLKYYKTKEYKDSMEERDKLWSDENYLKLRDANRYALENEKSISDQEFKKIHEAYMKASNEILKKERVLREKQSAIVKEWTEKACKNALLDIGWPVNDVNMRMIRFTISAG